MKATLTFNLPEERDEFTKANAAGDMAATLSDVDEFCRSSLKHGHKFQNPEEVMEVVRSIISDGVTPTILWS